MWSRPAWHVKHPEIILLWHGDVQIKLIWSDLNLVTTSCPFQMTPESLRSLLAEGQAEFHGCGVWSMLTPEWSNLLWCNNEEEKSEVLIGFSAQLCLKSSKRVLYVWLKCCQWSEYLQTDPWRSSTTLWAVICVTSYSLQMLCDWKLIRLLTLSQLCLFPYLPKWNIVAIFCSFIYIYMCTNWQ